jgi:prepilin-type processing-associated H-X9-DG protein
MKRIGKTILELVVVIGVVSILMALVIPAIQFARESARITKCKSNVRQLALAISSDMDSQSRLPENRFKVLNSNSRVASIWLDNCRPHLESTARSNELDTPPVLICPSAPLLRKIEPIADINEELVAGWGQTLDYSVSAGVSSTRVITQSRLPYTLRAGVAADIFQDTPSRRLGEIVAGRSNTLACWEISGAMHCYTLSDSRAVRMASWKELVTPLTIMADVGKSEFFQLATEPAAIRFKATSGGLARGYIAIFDEHLRAIKDSSPVRPHSSRVVNVSNKHFGPFSLHSNMVNFAMLDGSVHTMDQDVDPQVVFSLATVCED